ncbi:MFS transporter [Paenibacillus sp. FSL M7-1046]|uniref:MFS transporter n=1 Tax=Paenibacillus sp. FSL M7-1046 TaxID=2975315 RepID=UPI0030F6B977
MQQEVQTYKKMSSEKLWSLPYVFLMVSNALLFMVFEMMLPTLPLFVRTIGGDAAQIGLVTGSFTLSAILVRIFAGVLATKINKKYLLIIGVAICTLTTGAYYLAPNVSILVAIRLVNGAGFGLASTYFATIVAEVIPKERRGEGIGYFGVGETVAISIGPMIGIMLLDLYGYQRLFLGGMAILLLSIMSIFLVKRKVTEEVPLQGVRVKLFEKRVFFPSFLVFFTGFAASGIMSYLSLYALDKNFEQVGLFFFTIAIASFIVRFFSGSLFDKYGPSIILIPGAILSLLGFFVLFNADSNPSFFIAAFLYGFGFGAIFPAIQTWCLNLVEEHQHEDAMASFYNFFDIGIGGGAVLLGLLAAKYSYQAVFLVAMICYIFFLMMYTVYKFRKNMIK